MNNNRTVPRVTLQRYPDYLKALRKLKSMGITRIMSKELSEYVGIESTTIRRDFSFIGSLGKQGYGYDVEKLIEIFSDELGIGYDEKIILVGAGNLGKALMNYNRWNHVVGEIVCAFDINPDGVGKTSIPVYPMDKLEEMMPKNCHIAILCISDHVQETADKLIEAGITGIVDFTHDHIKAPKNIRIKSVDVVSSIQEIIFETNSNNTK